MLPVRVAKFESWLRLLGRVFSPDPPDWYRHDGHLLYRGMADSSWEPLTSADRFSLDHSLGDSYKVAAEMHRAYVENCHVLGTEATALREPDFTAFAQHHGLPTRMLDWSLSPFVALFFAYHDRLMASMDKPRTGSVAVWCLDVSGAVFLPEEGQHGPRPLEVLRTAPVHANPRLYRQMGVVTRNNSGQPLLSMLASNGWLDRLTQVVLPAKDVARALADLRRMGIDELRMFPDLEGAALEARARVLLRGPQGGDIHGST